MTRKLCTYPGCSATVEHSNDNTSPRCPEHPARNIVRKQYSHHKDQSGQDLYQTSRWKKLSKAFRTVHPLCVMCKQHGIITPAQLVDHIVEIEDGGEFFDTKNLQSLCKSCHNTKTGKAKRKRKQNTIGLKLSDFT